MAAVRGKSGIAVVLLCALATTATANNFLLGFGLGPYAAGPYGAGIPHYGASYKHGGGSMYHGDMAEPTAELLTGRERMTDDMTGAVLFGLAVTIQDFDTRSGHRGGYPGYPGFGFGGLAGLGYGHGAGYGDDEEGELEAIIELKVAIMFPSVDYLIVFTEAAPTSSDSDCPEGPILTRPLRDESEGDHGYGAFGGLYGGGYGGGYGHGYGMLGPMGGYGYGYGHDADMNTGVIAEVTVEGGYNTFQIQGLGPFKNRKDLAGRGIALCRRVEMRSGYPYCEPGTVLNCVSLGYASEPTRLSSAHIYTPPGPDLLNA